MPSFDVVSKVESHEVANAVDQATREITTRFDFKGVAAVFELKDNEITLIAPSDFHLQQMLDILTGKLIKRGVDTQSLEIRDPQVNLSQARQTIVIRQGIEADVAKKIVKFIKASGSKVQAAIEGDKIRVTGKKRDELQAIIALLKKESFELPLQFENFRD